MIERFELGSSNKVMEIASNDGYLLQHFVARGIPVLGIEPAANVAKVAIEKGIPTTVRFFGRETAAQIATQHGRPDLLLGNNVLAHVPDINDFVGGDEDPAGAPRRDHDGVSASAATDGREPVRHDLSRALQLSLVRRRRAHLRRITASRCSTSRSCRRTAARCAFTAVIPRTRRLPVTERVHALRQREIDDGFLTLERYRGFGEQVKATKRKLLSFLIDAKERGKTVVGYGAPGKGNTLLNYCGIRTDFLDFTVDANPYKQGKYTPGTRIPILAPEKPFARRARTTC